MAKKVKTAKPTGDQVYQPKDLTRGSTTTDYMVVPIGSLFVSYNKRPWFTLLQAESMLWDQQVWFGLQIGNSPLMQAEVEVVGPSTEVNTFVKEQWDRLWNLFSPKLVSTKYFGYAGFEITYCINEASRLYEIAGLKDFHPRDVRPLRQGGRGKAAGDIAGVVIRGQRYPTAAYPVDEKSINPTTLFGMRGLWLNYNANYGSVFGRALTEKAYPAWWDKAFQGGAYDLRRLRAVKDSWIGDVFKYPSKGKLTYPDGSEISAKDIVRELIENRSSGGVLAFPSDLDKDGHPLYEYQPPQGIAHTSIIQEWIKDCDWDIFSGLLVPREVVEAASSGSGFSGRSVPMMMFLNMRDTEFIGYVQAIKAQIMKPLVARNFGDNATDFDIKPIPLLETIGKLIGGDQTGGPVGKPGEPKPGQPGQPVTNGDAGDAPNAPPASEPGSMQFATAEEPPGTRAKRRAARFGLETAETLSGEVGRRLEALLKKN